MDTTTTMLQSLKKRDKRHQRTKDKSTSKKGPLTIT